MRAVIDTNIFLVSISRKSPYHWIFIELMTGSYTLCVSNEIVFEYEEIITQHMGREVSDAIKNFLLESPHIEMTYVYFNWNLLKDQDDNKFSDCYLASGSDFLVTHDKGFDKLSTISFPKFNIVTALEFKKILGAFQ